MNIIGKQTISSGMYTCSNLAASVVPLSNSVMIMLNLWI
jgi:hypothetical protein